MSQLCSLQLVVCTAYSSLFRLQVTVHNVMSVAVLYSADHLLKEAAGFVLGHLCDQSTHTPDKWEYTRVNWRATHTALAFLNDIIEQLFPRVFHHHDDVRRGCDHLVPTPLAGITPRHI